jgi:Flp pilus assembly protein TadG
MLTVRRKRLGRLGSETRGSEIAEAALVLPLMFMTLLGIFWFGQAFRIYGTITHAAREGARAGAAPACTSCAAGNTVSQNAYNAVQSALAVGKLDVTQASQPSTPPSLISCVDGSATGCDSNFSNVCVQPNIQLSPAVSGGSGVCGVSISFQYPYQFWFPGTSLNKQLIQLQAVARVRMETQ